MWTRRSREKSRPPLLNPRKMAHSGFVGFSLSLPPSPLSLSLPLSFSLWYLCSLSLFIYVSISHCPTTPGSHLSAHRSQWNAAGTWEEKDTTTVSPNLATGIITTRSPFCSHICLSECCPHIFVLLFVFHPSATPLHSG